MPVSDDFVEDQKRRALTKWKWHNPYLASFLALIHPIGMLYTSVAGFAVYLLVWLAIVVYWPGRPFGVGLALGGLFAAYAYFETRWRNAAIEKWKYGLPGTGHQNPRGLTTLQ